MFTPVDHAHRTNTHTGCLTPAAFAAGKDTVTMRFEKSVLFHPENFVRVYFPVGEHPVPREHADHWFLRATGAVICDSTVQGA